MYVGVDVNVWFLIIEYAFRRSFKFLRSIDFWILFMLWTPLGGGVLALSLRLQKNPKSIDFVKLFCHNFKSVLLKLYIIRLEKLCM